MGKLIDADALREEFRRDIMGGLNWDRILREAKNVDAVPVQRCDGCRYADWHSNGCIAYCTKHGTDGHVADSFCSEGEKDGDNG